MRKFKVSVLGLLALLLVGGNWTRSTAAQEALPLGRANIVFILTDDMRKADHQFTPRTRSLLGGAGTSFDNAFVSYSVCCPSRATALTGQYAHNHKVLDNTPEGDLPPGGAPAFVPHEDSTVATWLHGAGYETGLMGKYFNYYTDDHVPPGWDKWLAHDGRSYIDESGAPVINNEHDTDFLRQNAEDFIRGQGPDKPFFLYVAPYAPHPPAIPPKRYADDYLDLTLPRGGSFDEGDVSDKPPFIRELPRLSADKKAQLDELYRNRARSLKAVDDMVEGIVGALSDTGQLVNTYIVFTSDNGFHMGEHRLYPARKDTAYEEDIQVPLLIRGPRVPAGMTRSEFTLNTDLAPTLANWAEATPQNEIDGRSLSPLLDADPANDTPWRRRFLIEKWGAQVTPAPYKGVRTAGRLYVKHGNGPEELYNLESDPWEMKNVVSATSAKTMQSWRDKLATLTHCAGDTCRTAENP